MYEIKDTVRTYVMNDSFGDALQKLINNRYVVISGEPGIGKTTLARVLVMYLLSGRYIDPAIGSSYDEMYYTNSNLEDFADTLQDGKKQVFFYDDFLGQIGLEEEGKNYDSRIVKFIRACQRQKDKLLILTTREYILQQGLSKYARFNEGKGIEMSKCLVNMGKYTRFVRAQILYNHLESSQIPQPYIDDILKDKNYLRLIDHPHYSPRIIEAFVNEGVHEICEPNEYFRKIEGYFDHPDKVWLEAIDRLSEVARESLFVLFSMKPTVMYDDWQEAYRYFFEGVHKESNYFEEREWHKAVKELQGNFVMVNKGKFGNYVNFHNPGVRDVLSRYIKSDEALCTLLLKHAYFIDQVFGVFDDDRKVFHHAHVPQHLFGNMKDAFDRCWTEFRSCAVRTYRTEKENMYYRCVPQTRVEILSWLVFDYQELLTTIPGYVEDKVNNELMTDIQEDLSTQLSLLERIDLGKATLDMDYLFESFRYRLVTGEDCLKLAESIEKVFPDHKKFIESEEFCKLTAGLLSKDFGEKSESDLEELDSTAYELCKYNPYLEEEQVVTDIRKANEEFFESVDAMADRYADEHDYGYRYEPAESAWEIDNLFATLKPK